MLRHVVLWFLIILASLTGLGCARTVTSVITYGDEMSVEVSFTDTMNMTSNYYYMVISSQEAFQIPYDPYDPLVEFIEPGLPPSEPGVDYYEYYQTWDGYVILDNTGSGVVWLVNGPFTSSAESYADYTRTQIGEITQLSDKWTFNFDLSQLYGSAVPTTIYFDFITVASATKIVQDHLGANAYITSYADSTSDGSDDTTVDVDASQDIISYSVVVN